MFAFYSCVILVESSVCPSLAPFLSSLSLSPFFSLSYRVCVCVLHVHRCMKLPIHMHVWRQRRCQVSCIIAPHPVPLKPAFSLNLKLAWWPAGPNNPPVSPPYHSTGTTETHGHAWLLKSVLGIWTQVLNVCSAGTPMHWAIPMAQFCLFL